jgi:hypothetical protein
MKPRIITFFLFSAGILLSATALAKLVSSFGSAGILRMPDPVLGLPFRYMFLGVGACELAVAAVCFLGKNVLWRAASVAWLALSFVVYRAGLVWVGYHRPCSCLGNLTDMLHIRPEAADNAMKGVLVYLLIGSGGTLFWLWKQRVAAPPQPTRVVRAPATGAQSPERMSEAGPGCLSGGRAALWREATRDHPSADGSAINS